MKQENYLEGIYGCLERIEKKVEALPVEGTSPAVENRTSSPEGITELKIRLERLQSAVEKNSSEIAAVRSHTARLSEGRPLSAETFAGEMFLKESDVGIIPRQADPDGSVFQIGILQKPVRAVLVAVGPDGNDQCQDQC